jgi:DNA-binding SARP family transcriptional activator/predicted ATPase
MIPSLEIWLLGEYTVALAGCTVHDLDSARLQALLAYLILNRGVPQSRQRIAFLFWPETSDSQAQTNLRQLLHTLRKRLPDAAAHLDVGERTVHWRADSPATADVTRFQAATARAAQAAGVERLAALQEATTAYGGELLPGCYDDWILVPREQLAQQFTAALEQLALLYEERRAYPDAIGCAQRLLQHDSLHEAIYRRLMRLHALNGDRAAALRVYHTCVSLLAQELGVEPGTATRELYEHLVNADGEQSDAQPRAPDFALVGRDLEWRTLQAAWKLVSRGSVRCVVLQGEAGIGKTRLAEELVHWARQQGLLTATLHAYTASQDLPFAAVVEGLRGAVLTPLVRRLDAVWRTELARLLPELLVEDPQLAPLEPLTERWQRQRLFEALARVFVAGTRPVVLLVDDLQWCAGETLAWLAYLMRYQPQARLLVVTALRSDEIDDDHPAAALLLDLLTEVNLAPLSAEDTLRLARQLTGQTFDLQAADAFYRFTEGNPLFAVETLRADATFPAQRAAEPATVAGSPASRLPPRVQAVIQARLAQLSPLARDLAATAAAIGRSFTYAVLARACAHDEATVVNSLDELWRRRIVREQGATGYDFTHDRIRDVAYAAISPARRKLLHRRVAVALEHAFAADLDPVSAQIASHMQLGGETRSAITYYQRASEVALRLFAYDTAISLLESALTLVHSLPASTAAVETELELQMRLCTAWAAVTSYLGKEAERAYSRALELCQQVQQTPHLFTVLWGLHEVALYRTDYRASVELAQQCLAIAEELGDPGLLVEAHHAAWGPYYFIGEYDLAFAHMRAGLDLYNWQQHEALSADYGVHDACACALYESALIYWSTGCLDQAGAWLERAVAHARTLTMPANIADADAYAGLLYQLLRDPVRTQAMADKALTVSTEKGYPYTRFLSSVTLGWSLAAQGSAAEGVALARQGMAASVEFGQRLHHSQLAAMLAEACLLAGHAVEALDVAEEGIASFALYRDLVCAPDLWLLKGEALGRLGAPAAEIEECFAAGLALARELGARVSELRAATLLARHQQGQGRAVDACQTLQPVYAWFTEGHATPDLHAARALLAELSA